MLSLNKKKIAKVKNVMWNAMRSPRTIAFLKLGAAVVGVVHAIDELLDSPKSGKMPIGFRNDDS